MADFNLMRRLAQPGESKIVLFVMDGMGGLPIEPGGPTELEAAHTPNLDRLAAEGCCGLSQPIAPGVSPGSGPAHLALFGYDPLVFDVGRGVLEALGVDFALQPDDLAARGNFCTVDGQGLITDRRAGRIPTEAGEHLTIKLQAGTSLEGYEIFVQPVKEYRYLFVLRGPGLSSALSETDPLVVGKRSLPVRPLDDSAEAAHSASLVNEWLRQAKELLAGGFPANSLNLRGFAKDPGFPLFPDVFKLRSAAIAVYPMYRGVAQLVGMDVLDAGATLDEEIVALSRHWADYDFFFVHFKYTDSRGEDGDFAAKVKEIEKVDKVMPRILDLNPDVLIVTGDHSTPALLKSHSWHPVPTLLWSPTAMPDLARTFGERACSTGSLGTFPAPDLLPLALGHAQRLARYGA
ncbi:MAG TPA: 2,3-bisphosphoglycerate-independent phosphoglycerate mutase [Anaerolineae bacterium]|nr:2,3-bisphosphoglycerate-independent phosphoglycerate mutase [Anaerolineae bacterium]